MGTPSTLRPDMRNKEEVNPPLTPKFTGLSLGGLDCVSSIVPGTTGACAHINVERIAKYKQIKVLFKFMLISYIIGWSLFVPFLFLFHRPSEFSNLFA